MGAGFKNRSVFWVLGLILALVTACGQKSPPSTRSPTGVITNYSSCAMPDSQGVGSLKGSWRALPIRVAIDRDFYITDGGAQANAIKRAIDTWNAWGAIRGFGVFQLVDDGTGVSAGRQIPAFDDTVGCDASMFTNNVTDNTVVIWKIRAGGDGRNNRGSCDILPTGVQGLTDWVVNDGYITKASILLNFEGFNYPGKRPADLQSLALHELGHVVGLLHSCKSSDGDESTSPKCYDDTGNVVVSTKFAEAVMFPVLRDAQIRRALKQNDYDRINCLY
jgi:hypothetical protein